MDEHAKRSGSENRQRTEQVITRLTPAERQQIEDDAESAGLTLGSYVRAKLFSGPPVRAVRAPSIEKKALAQFLAWLGRLRGSVYQISRRLNFGQEYESQALMNALKEISDMRNAVLLALGHEPL
jgi:hypothetical protein